MTDSICDIIASYCENAFDLFWEKRKVYLVKMWCPFLLGGDQLDSFPAFVEGTISLWSRGDFYWQQSKTVFPVEIRRAIRMDMDSWAAIAAQRNARQGFFDDDVGPTPGDLDIFKGNKIRRLCQRANRHHVHVIFALFQQSCRQ
jgi:hypothetical protein